VSMTKDLYERSKLNLHSTSAAAAAAAAAAAVVSSKTKEYHHIYSVQKFLVFIQIFWHIDNLFH